MRFTSFPNRIVVNDLGDVRPDSRIALVYGNYAIVLDGNQAYLETLDYNVSRQMLDLANAQ